MNLIEKIQNKRAEQGRKKPLKTQFIEQIKNIEKAIQAGYQKTEIWKVLSDEGLFEGSYVMFSKYCRNLIKQKIKQDVKEPKRFHTPKKRTFHFDPIEDKRYLLEKATDD